MPKRRGWILFRRESLANPRWLHPQKDIGLDLLTLRFCNLTPTSSQSVRQPRSSCETRNATVLLKNNRSQAKRYRTHYPPYTPRPCSFSSLVCGLANKQCSCGQVHRSVAHSNEKRLARACVRESFRCKDKRCGHNISPAFRATPGKCLSTICLGKDFDGGPFPS